MTARPTQATTNKKNNENNLLVAYRLEAVENAVTTLTSRFDKLNNINKDDLKEFGNTITSRFTDVKSDLQKQIDSKANLQEFKDFKKQMAGIGALVGALLVATYSYILTRLH